MAKNEDLYKLFIDYIREDNKWKETMNKQVSSIEYQTKLTNGRINKIEPIVDDLKRLNDASMISRQINWKYILAGASVLIFLLEAAFFFVLDWLKARFIN
jgi:hypothetical protein